MAEMDQDSAREQALRGVVERVTAWQETAPEGTIHEELDKALREAGVTLTADQKEHVTQQISNGEQVDEAALANRGDAGGPA